MGDRCATLFVSRGIPGDADCNTVGGFLSWFAPVIQVVLADPKACARIEGTGLFGRTKPLPGNAAKTGPGDATTSATNTNRIYRVTFANAEAARKIQTMDLKWPSEEFMNSNIFIETVSPMQLVPPANP